MNNCNITVQAINAAMDVMTPHQLIEFRKRILELRDMTTQKYSDMMVNMIDEYISAKDPTVMALAEFNESFKEEK